MTTEKDSGPSSGVSRPEERASPHPSPLPKGEGIGGRSDQPSVLSPQSLRGSQPFAAEPREGFVSIGRVLGSWGVRGALKVESLTDFPERFDVGERLWLGGVRRRIERSHWQRGAAVIQVSGIDDANVAAGLRGALVELPETELRPLGEDEYYQHDLLGLPVQTISGEELGTVQQILSTGANDVLVVRGSAGEYLLPLIADVIRRIDLAGHRITVELIDGLEPTPVRTPRPPRRPRPKPAG